MDDPPRPGADARVGVAADARDPDAESRAAKPCGSLRWLADSARIFLECVPLLERVVAEDILPGPMTKGSAGL
jgi:hypothetical protein